MESKAKALGPNSSDVDSISIWTTRDSGHF